MKSRIAGSVDQARRSAARVRSAGTPGAKKGRMSDAAPIDSIGGKFAASKGDSVGEGCPGFAMDWVRTCMASRSPLDTMGRENSWAGAIVPPARKTSPGRAISMTNPGRRNFAGLALVSRISLCSPGVTNQGRPVDCSRAHNDLPSHYLLGSWAIRQAGGRIRALARHMRRPRPCRKQGWTLRGVPVKVFGSEINCPESAPSDGRGGDQLRQVPAR